MTPAMAAGVTDRLWEIADLVALLDAEEFMTELQFKIIRLFREGEPTGTGNPLLMLHTTAIAHKVGMDEELQEVVQALLALEAEGKVKSLPAGGPPENRTWQDSSS